MLLIFCLRDSNIFSQPTWFIFSVSQLLISSFEKTLKCLFLAVFFLFLFPTVALFLKNEQSSFSLLLKLLKGLKHCAARAAVLSLQGIGTETCRVESGRDNPILTDFFSSSQFPAATVVVHRVATLSQASNISAGYEIMGKYILLEF